MSDTKLDRGVSSASPFVVNACSSLAGFESRWNMVSPVGVHSKAEMITDAVMGDTLESGVRGACITVGHVYGDVDPFEHTVADIGRWNTIIRQRSGELLKVSTADDIERARKETKVGVIYTFQNSLMLGDSVDRVDIFADLGVRVFQLTYNAPNSLGDGCTAPDNRPLTPLGQSVVARLSERRVICDLAHSGQQTCLDAARRSSRPVIISHTGCRALVDLPRNKSDEELRLVAERGGFVGIYFVCFVSHSGPSHATDVVAHIEHAINVCGEDHVGIGSDYSSEAVRDVERYMARHREAFVTRDREGVNAPGEYIDVPFMTMDLTGPAQFVELAHLLRNRGHSQSRVEKILGCNFLRVCRDVWGS